MGSALVSENQGNPPQGTLGPVTRAISRAPIHAVFPPVEADKHHVLGTASGTRVGRARFRSPEPNNRCCVSDQRAESLQLISIEGPPSSVSTDSAISWWADTCPPGQRTVEIPVGGQAS